MAGKTQFEQFIADEIEKNRGRLVPVKASLAERMFVRKAHWKDLHPNPDDEFCLPSIGPSFEIISNYEQMIREGRFTTSKAIRRDSITVEKVLPEGYMILNGHHRWGAAVKMNYSPLPISIVNLTHETDVERMVARSRHDKRVTLDLDETVFRKNGDPCLEKALSFPFNRIYKERLRRGIPALFHSMVEQGYDIWVYTAQYYSLEYIRSYFRHYRIPVTGIVTGTAREGGDAGAQFEKMLAVRYGTTLHIDNGSVLHTRKGSKEYEVYALHSGGDGWTAEIMDVVGGRI